MAVVVMMSDVVVRDLQDALVELFTAMCN